MKKLLFFWKELGETFWFLPVLIIGFSILLSIGLVYLDNLITIPREGWVRIASGGKRSLNIFLNPL